MSRVGKQIISVPAGVEVKLDAGILTVRGPKGELSKPVRDEVTLTIENNTITSEPRRNDKFSKSLWGTYMSLIKAMISGVVTPFEKKLIVEGVGFKWEVKGDELVMNLGFSHQVIMKIPSNITVTTAKLELTVSGLDKEAVTLFAMQVKKKKVPEPYKGKGIRYAGEVIRRKEGKKSA
jgi:large subunit ribosomal protein L6